ncbi:MAG TPA: peptidoglycan DD-metalloendopeptidase family protein [Bryobacteraceae bacterium]|nr:peptidoglycan DD-metalloendopeptidase family protein [Bryobacteraceae bacterium]
MKQQYFILVLAHSLHGRLRRIHIPHQVLYIVLALALVGGFSIFGFVSSYARMAWKVANYNSLRREADELRVRYQNLQKVVQETNEQLATLEVLANEVTVAYGIKQKLEGPADIAAEGKLTPSFSATVAEYNYLRTSNLSRFEYARRWQVNTRPSMWPVDGAVMSSFGGRTDPFSGEGAWHTGIDISASIGTPARATADGIVTFADRFGGYGRLVIIDHGNGFETYYAHLSRFDVIAGQEIRQGETVGAVGATGRVTAPHLHYEVRLRTSPVNPYKYLKPVAQAKVAEYRF